MRMKSTGQRQLMYTFHSRIRYSEVGADSHLTLKALLDYFQDCSTFQSEDLQIGLEYMAENHVVWVLSSWQIDVKRYPKLGEQVEIGTQPYDIKGFLGFRNFMMWDSEGQIVACANSIWSLLDTDTGRPVRVMDFMKQQYAIGPKLEMEYLPRKISLPENGSEKEPITIVRHHLDTNQHVNNGQYVMMAMEYLPADRAIRRMRAEYMKSALLGDQMIPVVTQEKDTDTIELRSSDGKPFAVVSFELQS